MGIYSKVVERGVVECRVLERGVVECGVLERGLVECGVLERGVVECNWEVLRKLGMECIAKSVNEMCSKV